MDFPLNIFIHSFLFQASHTSFLGLHHCPYRDTIAEDVTVAHAARRTEAALDADAALGGRREPGVEVVARRLGRRRARLVRLAVVTHYRYTSTVTRRLRQ